MQTALASSIIQRARYAADGETPTPTVDFVTDVESLTYLTSAYRKLLDLITDAGGVDLLLLSTTLTSPSYTLPTNFYRAAAIDAQLDSNRWTTLRRFNFAERNRRNLDTSFPLWRIVGTTLMFEPSQARPTPLRLWYIADFSAASATSDVIQTFGGWDEFLVLDVAMQMLMKEERDMSAQAARYGEVKHRIEIACRELCVVDVETAAKTEAFEAEVEDYLWCNGDAY